MKGSRYVVHNATEPRRWRGAQVTEQFLDDNLLENRALQDLDDHFRP